MTTFKIKYVKRMRDRHGHWRHYYNRAGYPKTPLPGLPGSKEFMAAYKMAGGEEQTLRPGAGRVAAGTLAALLAEYYASATFHELLPQTRRNYRFMLERFRNIRIPDTSLTCGDCQVKAFRRVHIDKILDGLKETPGTARNMLRRVRGLFAFAVKREYRDDNPVTGIDTPAPKSRDGFTPWSDADIAVFMAHWPEGSKPRLAMTILLRTAVRRSDAVILGRQHMVATDMGNELHFRSKKGNVWMEVPVDRELQAELDRLPSNQMQFLQTDYGKPFSEAGFTKWFRERAEIAGIYGRTPHGLRKAAARHMAESGSTPHEIGAVDGHQTLSEVERYTRSANRRTLAWAAVAKREQAKK